jgi:septal ring factor EnvC (AmiA/AmiB activator)
MKYPVFFTLFFLFLFTADLSAQTNRQRLEAKRIALQKQIEEINQRISEVDKTKMSALQKAEQIREKIRIRKKLTDNMRREINSITRQINKTEKEINRLEKELNQLKREYAAMIRQAYKSRSRNGKLYFLFSSDNFYQAFKRMQYLKQFSMYRKKQGEEILKKKEKLIGLQKTLKTDREQKRKLYAGYKKEQAQIKKEEQAQMAIIAEIQKKKSHYLAQIKKKEKEKRKIDKLIEAEIRKAIARSNKKSKKNTSGSKKMSKTKFFLTPEGKKLADKFSANRGILPWPVTKAYITRRFGVQKHEIFKNVVVQNSGINIATTKGAKVRAVFEGKVLQIQIIPGGNTAVYIKHGDYITIYKNLKKVYVKPGDKVKTKQTIGVVATDPTTGKTEIKFMIYKNLTKLNPEKWLLKK